MKIEVPESGNLVFYAEDAGKTKTHVFLYRLSPADKRIREDPADDYYIAVPNGRNVAVRNLPEGSYELQKLN